MPLFHLWLALWPQTAIDMTHRRLAQSDRMHCVLCMSLYLSMSSTYCFIIIFSFILILICPHVFLPTYIPPTNRQAKHQLRDRLIQGQTEGILTSIQTLTNGKKKVSQQKGNCPCDKLVLRPKDVGRLTGEQPLHKNHSFRLASTVEGIEVIEVMLIMYFNRLYR